MRQHVAPERRADDADAYADLPELWVRRSHCFARRQHLAPRYEEPAHSGIVYENRIKKEVSTRLESINAEVVNDPTLQRSRNNKCENCGNKEAVLFQAESGVTAKSLSLIFVCCNCRHKWVG
mmetsp:Transcript_20879/g.67254  ORF Transcript_20879/g.67254 Transcript_20879/m.67254 type:complete len:122 (-) Transcript_20879:72-437(-)